MSVFSAVPAWTGDPDGPEVFHLVIIDNGRSRILADPEFREVLACIRCGACLNICPVYGKIGGHAYRSAYCGPIGAVVTPLLEGINNHADLCKGETLCGACRDVCPVDNDLPRMLAALRHKLAYGDHAWQVRPHDRIEAIGFRIWRWMISSGTRYRSLLAALRLLQKVFGLRKGMITRLPGPGKGWTEGRDLTPLAARPFSTRWRSRKNRAQPKSAAGRGKPDEH